jgi:hypothetical protein
MPGALYACAAGGAAGGRSLSSLPPARVVRAGAGGRHGHERAASGMTNLQRLQARVAQLGDTSALLWKVTGVETPPTVESLQKHRRCRPCPLRVCRSAPSGPLTPRLAAGRRESRAERPASVALQRAQRRLRRTRPSGRPTARRRQIECCRRRRWRPQAEVPAVPRVPRRRPVHRRRRVERGRCEEQPPARQPWTAPDPGSPARPVAGVKRARPHLSNWSCSHQPAFYRRDRHAKRTTSAAG